MKPLSQTKILGNQGEQFVMEFLQKNGFTVCSQNYRKFFGEIDVIAYKKNLYVFVEVKTRKSDVMPLGHLIGPTKQAKIIKTAQSFISQQQLCADYTCRFDVALLVQQGTTFDMQYIENAFTQSESAYGY